jgi:dihydroneopterin aldolase
MFDSYTKISLDTVRLTLRIGYFDWEQQDDKLWPVDVSVDLYTSQTHWPSPTMKTIIDYNRVHAYLQTWQEQPHREFLEAYAEDLLSFCFSDLRVEACRVRLVKPAIYAGAAGAGVEIRRTRAAQAGN